MMSTKRERIAQLLEMTEEPMTAQEIRDELGLRTRNEVYEAIDHIAKSAKREGKEVLIRPASCAKCGYVFSGRASLRRPSRCPQCKSEWIIEPAYLIRPRKKQRR
ncbi:MAG: transcriptional regulator [Candidatus Thorarchaeota archaeon]|nr:MAG: transcriptional regulator [Candidatus Thorarchaeota archaeon]